MRRRVVWSVVICAVMGVFVWAIPRMPLRHVVRVETVAAQFDRKLIEVGWDAPTVAYLQANLDRLQDRPFDGMAFRFTKQVPRAFENRRWTEDDTALPLLDQFQWGRFTDNFLLMWGQSDPAVDWFDDGQWETITANMRQVSHALHIAKASGVMFDPEFYFTRTTHSPWVYSPELYPERSFEVVQAQVRARGADFVTALQTEMPTLQFVSMWSVGEAYARANERPALLPQSAYALLPAFLYGMLDAKGAEVTIIDGNETSYYVDETTDFVRKFAYERFNAAALVPANERDRYIDEVKIASAVYTDYVLALRDWQERGWSEERKLRWLEHNAYHALLTSEHYAWVWSENLNWWGYDQNIDSSDLAPSNVPAPVTQAFVNARQRFIDKQALDFEMVYIGGASGNKMADTEFVTTPTVILTAVDGRSEFAQGETIRLTITVDGAEIIDRTEIYANAIRVGSTNETFDLQGLAAGDYIVFARTFTKEGKHRTSNLITVRIR